MSLALQGGFLTTGPPEKSPSLLLLLLCYSSTVITAATFGSSMPRYIPEFKHFFQADSKFMALNFSGERKCDTLRRVSGFPASDRLTLV